MSLKTSSLGTLGFCPSTKSKDKKTFTIKSKWEVKNKPFPNKKYQIIYADPPWLERGAGRIVRGAQGHYKLMSTLDICNLEVKSITSCDCHLYLWTTNNFLRDGFKVIDAWGFRYITMITWVKDKTGLGQYFRGQTEHCLFSIRGALPYLRKGKRAQYSTVFYEPKGSHSEKPEKMRRIIEYVSGAKDRKMIELFARKESDGWDVWGNEV